MSKRVAIIGYGSIGKRHATILSKLPEVSDIVIFTSQEVEDYEVLENINQLKYYNPNYIIISSRTRDHYNQLLSVDKQVNCAQILIEKPLFTHYLEINSLTNDVYVAYNLRYHPVIQKAKQIISGREILVMHSHCYTYLPNWRIGRDYRQTYSSSKEDGGALLDLSHELDYLLYLAGEYSVDFSRSEKLSSLEIESDDSLLLIGSSSNKMRVQVSLQMYSQMEKRGFSIIGNDLALYGDLLENTLEVVDRGEQKTYSWDVSKELTYRLMHQALLDKSTQTQTTYEEGLKIMRLITEIRENGAA